MCVCVCVCVYIGVACGVCVLVSSVVCGVMSTSVIS